MRKIALILMILLMLPLSALAADYSIPRYSMDVALEADGSARVVEDLTYRFDGGYNGILSSFDVGDLEGLEDLALYVDGDTLLTRVDEMHMEPYTYTLERDGEFLNVQAYAPGSGGERAFRYEYRMLGLAQRYRDAARLNYRLIGIANQRALESAIVRVRFPGGAPDRYFVHGAMDDGDAVLGADGTLTLGPERVRSGQYVELDALFPAESLAAAPLVDRPIVEEALEAERRLAEQKAREAVAQARMRYGVAGLLLVFFGGAAFLLRGKLARYGVKKDIPPASDFAALDGLDAAVAQRLVQNRNDASAFSATLLELAQKGALQMSSEIRPATGEQATRFAVKNRGAEMSAQQRALFDWLFGGRESLWIDELDAGRDQARARAFANDYNRWGHAVRQQAVDQGLYFDKRGVLGCGFAILAAAGALISVAVAFLGLWWLTVVGLLLAAALIAGFTRVRSLTDAGEAKFAAVRGYCEKYGEKLSDIPADALGYIPILVALGYVEPLAKYLDQRAAEPDYGYGSMLPVWWYGGWYHDVGRARRSFDEVRRHNNSVASQSSGSSGGGFSGSSGGGGGGGGHGAW